MPGVYPLLAVAATIGFMAASDYLVQEGTWIPRNLRAVYDNFTHGTIAGLLAAFTGRGRASVGRFLAGYVVGAGLDIDHAIAARSLRLGAMLSLGGRPFSHSLAFSVATAIAVGAVSRRPSWAWLVFFSLASHVIRDAGLSRAPIFWPLPPAQLPALAYYSAIAALALISSTMLKQRQAR